MTQNTVASESQKYVFTVRNESEKNQNNSVRHSTVTLKNIF